MHETTCVIDEKVTRKVEQCEDPATGKLRFQTIEYVEKLVEHKVWASVIGSEAVQGCFRLAGGQMFWLAGGTTILCLTPLNSSQSIPRCHHPPSGASLDRFIPPNSVLFPDKAIVPSQCVQ